MPWTIFPTRRGKRITADGVCKTFFTHALSISAVFPQLHHCAHIFEGRRSIVLLLALLLFFSRFNFHYHPPTQKKKKKAPRLIVGGSRRGNSWLTGRRDARGLEGPGQPRESEKNLVSFPKFTWFWVLVRDLGRSKGT